jgi:hypothetical protein
VKISTSENTAMGMRGRNFQRVKIEIDGKAIKQVGEFI